MAAAVTDELNEVPDLPGIDAGIVHPYSPHAGSLFVQGAIDDLPFDDVHGAGWRLVTLDADAHAIDPAGRAWFESIGGQVIRLTDPDATYDRWFAEKDAAWALQRPDFYLYGTATTPAGAS